jgi:small-conductance mechanosensitive channel
MTLPQWSALLHEAELWFRTSILTWNTALQVGAVLLCAGLGLLLGRSARRAYRRRFAEQLESDVFFGKLFRAVDRVLWLSVAGVLLTVAGVAFRSMAEPARLLDVATTLTLAWIAIRLASGLILNRFWGHAASVSVWILVALDVVGLLDPLLTFMNDLGMNFGDARVTLLQAVKAVLLFVLLYQLAAALSRFSDDRLQRNMQLTPSAQVLFGKGVKFSLFTLAFVLALSSAGVNLTSLAVLSGAIGVGVGFGLQKIFANLVSGIILLFEKSIKPGDTVEMGGVYGVVRSLNARFTSVLTRDGKEYGPIPTPMCGSKFPWAFPMTRTHASPSGSWKRPPARCRAYCATRPRQADSPDLATTAWTWKCASGFGTPNKVWSTFKAKCS